MRIRHYFLLATNNLLRRKRTLKFNILLIALSLTIICLTNTLTSSLGSFIDKFLYNSIEFRTITLNGYKYDTEFKDKIEKVIEGDSHILELYHELFGVKVKLEDTKAFININESEKTSSVGDMVLLAARKQDKTFLTSGRFIEDSETNVGVIPKKFYPDGAFQIEYSKNNTDFIDGDSLIGKTITVNYDTYDYRGDGFKKLDTFSYSFKVVGTYDILPNNYYPYNVLVSYKDLKTIVEALDKNNVGLAENFATIYSVIVDDQKNVEDIITKFNVAGIGATRKSVLGDIGILSKYILASGYILGYLILLISIINISLTMVGSIKKRTGEIGLMKAIGYYDSQISLIVIMEAFIIGVISLLITLGIWASFNLGLRFIIANYTSIYMQSIEVKWDIISILQIAALSIMTPILGSFLGIRRSIKITPKAALNKGC